VVYLSLCPFCGSVMTDAMEGIGCFKCSPYQQGVLRCFITSNQCGTDTWPEGYECKCDNCQEYLMRARIKE
jgi:hypothetical protein